MRHLSLLQILIILVLGTWASPVPADKRAVKHQPRQPDLEKGQFPRDLASTPRELTSTISTFDMASHVTMYGKPATGTNALSDDALIRAKFPQSLTLEQGAFTTDVDPNLLVIHDVDKYLSAMGLLRAAQGSRLWVATSMGRRTLLRNVSSSICSC
jgi:hypothetical protein